MRAAYTLLTVLTAAVLGLGLWWTQTEPDVWQARLACRAALIDQATAPGSIRWVDDTVTVSSEGSYTFNGRVEGQNGFGATIRTAFHCVAYRTMGGEWVAS